MEYILLLVGFILLIKGADFFVEGSSSLAGILKVPSVIIGLTIVAMGTSAPEASVSINAALAGSNDIAISNVVGSNIFNGLVVVGICAFLHSFMPHGEILKRDMPLNILVTVVLCLMFLDGRLSRIEGAVLLLGMIVYLGFMIYSARKNREEGEPGKILSLPRSLLYIAGGLAAVIFGVLAVFIKTVLPVKHPERHFLMVVDDLLFSNPFQCWHGSFLPYCCCRKRPFPYREGRILSSRTRAVSQET